MNLFTDRQERYWGEAGQKILLKGSVMIVGLGPLGIETAKAVAALGVGRVYLGDDNRVPSSHRFVESFLPASGRSTAEELADSLRRFNFLPEFSPQAISADPTSDPTIYLDRLVRGKPGQLVICTSNNVAWQEYAAGMAQEKKIPFLIATCDDQHLSIRGQGSVPSGTADSSLFSVKGKAQTCLLSSLTAGLLAERVQQAFFQERVKEFEGCALRDAQGKAVRNSDGSERHISSRVKKYRPFEPADFEFPDPVSSIRNPRHYVLLGAGAIINHTAKNLSEIVSGELTVIDFDKIHITNLHRCEMFLDSPYGKKAEVIARKINILNPELHVRPIFGVIGDEETVRLVYKNFGKGDDGPACIDRTFMESLRPDILVAGFDNRIARAYTNKLALSLRIPYIDGASSVTGAEVRPVIPGKTGCMNCYTNVDALAEAEQLVLAKLARQGCQRPDIHPSIDASNRIAGALQAYLVTHVSRTQGSIDCAYLHDSLDQRYPIKTQDLTKSSHCLCQKGHAV